MEKSLNVNIREAVGADSGVIAGLERVCFPIPWTEESIYKDIDNNEIATVLVADADGNIAGYLNVWCIAGEAQLNNIAVFPEYRGMHIGQRLMDCLLDRLKNAGISDISLEVRPSNDAAISLYEKLGFVVEGRREGYYLDNGEAALIMRKAL